MDYRRLGHSGLRMPALSFGTATFGGGNDFFRAWGATDAAGATRLVDICLEHGVSMFDSADSYSQGLAEEILGKAIKGRRNRLLISTKTTFPVGDGPNDYGSSRQHLLDAIDKALKRLGTDHIDLWQLHGQDYNTPLEETLATLDQIVRDGKVRYIGCSNFSGWHLMKSLAVADRYGYPRHVAHQAYYSLLNRDYEWELMPLGRDQGVGGVIWSPLGWGKLTGKIRRGQPAKPGMRAHDIAGTGPRFEEERLFRIIDALDAVAAETGKSIPQVALNWLLSRPTVASVIIGARDEAQLKDNIGAIGWSLNAEQNARLEAASDVSPAYPVWHQRGFAMLNERG
ncbi:aldo/keto reductase [Phreatobacter sp. AB_2022a]|uniref:aldo/keto reductase n=1 Tax=Phreatobacter sp. AB_2022a TaxID=3003134 RepID=UPI0022874C00|nr:aldo/keto reductase [Phreatobacter sp. AB_2022a]MCZ0734251.1 aldo/keto reductase [Phreatobacter sp. AB_2022a]